MHHFILLCFTSAHSAHILMVVFCGNTLYTTSFCSILWQHIAPLHYAAYCGDTMHHFVLLYSIATHCVPLHSANPMAAHYALLHVTVFYGKSICTTKYESILWQHTIHNFILLCSVPTHYACVWPTRDLFYMSCITCACKKSGLVTLHSCTQGKLQYNLPCAM